MACGLLYISCMASEEILEQGRQSMLCLSILMLQEVVLKVVTPPTFTNTSESEVRVETGRPAALFCHAEGITVAS